MKTDVQRLQRLLQRFGIFPRSVKNEFSTSWLSNAESLVLNGGSHKITGDDCSVEFTFDRDGGFVDVRIYGK